MSPLIVADRVTHHYGSGQLRKRVLSEVSAEIMPGEIVILTGPSGSGKTTLLTLAGALRSVQEGSMKVLGTELNGATPDTLVKVREEIGFIFQAHNLIDSLSATKNVEMGLGLMKLSAAECRKIAVDMLTSVGLGQRVDYLPSKLSGGQKQRVAIARALVRKPKIILADEPTAALDRKSGREVVELLQDLAKGQGCAILLVTHDNRILDVADRIMTLEDGSITSFAQGMAANASYLLGAMAKLHERGDLTSHVESLSNKQFVEMLEQMTSEFEQFLRVSELGNQQAVQALFDQVLFAVGRKVRRLLKADRGAIFLIDRERGELYSKVATGDNSIPISIRIPLQSGIAGLVARTGQSVNVPDAYAHSDFNPEADRTTGYRTQSILCVPIFDRAKKLFAVAQLINKQGAPAFDSADEATFNEFAELFSIVLEACIRLQDRRAPAAA